MPHEINTTQTRHDLRQDAFVNTTGTGIEWARQNRRTVILTTSILLAVIVLALAVGLILHHRSEAASTAFGQAMETLQSPIATPGQPPMPGVKSFNSAADRAAAAAPQFHAVADQYSSTKDGKNARYFEGLMYLDQAKAGPAESTLKTVADSWDKELASLAKFALADLYRQTGRDAQAVDLYNQLAAKPTDAIPAGLAQLQLAEVYTTQGKLDQAHKIYAQLKDKDAKGAAGVIAAKKLNPAATPEPQL